MARTTIPPTIVTTGTTTKAFPGVSPIDAYQEGIDRPLAWFESTITTALATATASVPTMYVKGTNTSGMSGNLSATVAHFQCHIGGTNVDKLACIAVVVQADTSFTSIAGNGLGSNYIITPISAMVRAHPTGTLTFAGAQVVFGIHAQYLAGTGTTAPTYMFFARLNCSTAITALFYTDNTQSAGWVAAGTHTTEYGQVPLIYVHSAPGAEKALFVKLYGTA